MKPRLQPFKILLIDDDEDDHAFVRYLLSDFSTSGSQLEWAADYETARKALYGGRYDVCLLDYRLDAQNGLELLKEAVDEGIGTPIIFLTGQGDYELDLEVMKAGAADYLTKDQLSAALLERSIRYAVDRRQRTVELFRAKRVIQTLSECNQAVIQSRNEADLLQEVCRIVVQVGNYRLAWVAYAEADPHTAFTPVAQYGHAQAPLAQPPSLLAELPTGLCPTATCIRTGHPHIIRFQGDHTQCIPWTEEALDHGHAAMIALPLFWDEQVLGALTIHASAPNALDAEEVELLLKLADNLSHGIGVLRTRQARMEAEKSLKNAYNDLEARVQARTAELMQVNAELSREIEERKRAEQALDKQRARIQAVLDNIPAGVILYEGRPLRLVLTNRLGERLLHRGMPAEIAPDNIAPFFQAYRAGTDEFYPAEEIPVVQAMRGKFTAIDDMEIRYGNGSRVRLEMFAAPVRDAAGQITAAVAIFQNISKRKQTEQALRDSLQEKTALLKEVHHRVKNNLQVVASILSLQATRAQDRLVVDVLQNTRNRVHSMALLHEILYRSGNLARINFAAYVGDLCRQLLRSFGPVAARVRIDNRIGRIGLPLEQSVPCGLIINELLSNALKHAFSDHREGLIIVDLQPMDSQTLVLSVTDNGVGLRPGVDPTNTPTLGLQLVSNLAGQLGGRLISNRSDDGGISFQVIFPVPRAQHHEGEP